VLDSETKRRIDTLRDILVGKIPNPQSQVEQITTGLIYKFMNDMDEESIELGGNASFFVGDYEKYAWNNLFDTKLGGVDRVNLYSEAIENMYFNPSAPQLFRDIFKNVFLPFKDPSTLNMFLKEIDEFHYSHSEKLGDAFEYLISIMGSQGDAGQFRTPRHIIDFIVEIVNPQKEENILDPACGTAGFLISSYKHILKSNTDKKLGDQLSAEDRKKIGNNLSGYDISPEMIRLSLVNMYLHGFKTPKVDEYDTLSSEDKWNEYYDVIIANPPFFSPKGGIQPHKRFGVHSKKAEVLFTSYILDHLKPEGRAGVIVPEGIIFQTGKAYKDLRKQLIENGLIGIISLPAGVFNPYSGVKTSILILDKKLYKDQDSIFFEEVNNDGFDLGAKRKPIKENDLPGLAKEVQNLYSKLKPSNLLMVEREKLLSEKDYLFTKSSYVENNYYDQIQFSLKTLDDCVDIFSGSREKGGAKNEGIPSIGGGQITSDGKISKNKMAYISEDFYESLIRGKIYKGDVLIVKDGATTGKVGIYNGEFEKAAVNEHVFCLRSKENINQKYLYYLLRSESFQNILQPYINGIIGGINLNIKEIEIPLPLFEIQQEIVDELEGYQIIVDGCKQVVENYKPTIDIDPNWEKVELGEICSFAYGKGLKESDRKGGEYPVFGSNGVVGYHNNYLVKGPFLIIGRKGSAGNVNFSTKNGFPIDTTFYISENEIKNELISLDFLYLTLLSLDLINTSSKQIIPGLNRNDAYKKIVGLPALEIQKEIVQKIEEERKVIEGNKILIKIYTQKIQDRINKVWGE
jgi:type I restriction enzyme M protein